MEEFFGTTAFEQFNTDELTAEVGVVDNGAFRKPRTELIYRLGDWEGPFALLYELVVRYEVDIKDIILSKVVGAYVDIIMSAQDIDADYAGDFLVIGSKLLLFKARRLFPDEELTEEQLSEESELIDNLEEYRMIKEATIKLQEKETLNRFYREPTFDEDDCVLIFKNLVMEKLVDAFAIAESYRRHREVTEDAEPKMIYRDPHTVEDRYNFIYKELEKRDSMTFFEMFEDDDLLKSEIVNTFLAILALMKDQYITAVQDEETLDIRVRLKDSGIKFVEARSEEDLLNVKLDGTD